MFLILWNLNTIGLYLLGDTTEAKDITVSRIGSKDDADIGSEYRFDIGYTYIVDGVSYRGINTGVRGPRLGPNYNRVVYYYPFAPKINSLFANEATSIGTVLATGFGLLLLVLALLPDYRKKVDSTSVMDTAPRPVTMAWLMEHTQDYDDRLEEYYQQGWDKNDPSWQCSCGKWNTDPYCKACGKPKCSSAKTTTK